MGCISQIKKWVLSIRWRDFLSWYFLKDPLAICSAVVGAVLIAVLSNSFDPYGTLNLVWIVTTILLIMTFGSADRILVQAVFRIIGTIVGVGIGALLAFGHGQMVNDGVSSVGLYAYQLSLQVVVILLVAVGVKLFPYLNDVFLIVALTTAILLFSPDLSFAHSRTLSVLLASGAAFLCTFLFHYTLAEELLFQEHRSVAENLLRLTEYAIKTELSAKHEFDLLAHDIRNSLYSMSSAWAAYYQWRKWSFRRVSYNFNQLTDALRPLYYEVFSLYWSSVETALRPRDAALHFCDTEADFEALFRPLIEGIRGGVEKCRKAIPKIIQPTAVAAADRRFEIEDLIGAIAPAFYIDLEILNMRYIDNRLICFSNRYQRWNMCDYLVTLSCVLMELVEYLKVITLVFAKEDLTEYADLVERLTVLKNRINGIRYQTHASDLIVDVVPLLS